MKNHFLKTIPLILPFLYLFSLADTSKFIITNVPFYPSEDNQCGPTSLAMVLNFLGIEISPSEISKEIYSKGAGGTSDFDMIRYVKKLGLKGDQYKGSVADLKSKISEGNPLIVMTDEGFWFYRKYHFMVVIGFSEDGIIVNSGKKEKEYIKLETFLKKWEKTNFWTFFIYREERNGHS